MRTKIRNQSVLPHRNSRLAGGLIFAAAVFFVYNIDGTVNGKASSQEELPVNPISGRIVFEEKGCIDCHAVDGFGGSDGPDLGRQKFFGSFYDLASRLWNHAPEMAVQSDFLEKKWPSITSAEMDRLISYLFFLRYLGEPGNVAEGKKLLQEKKCLTCHRIEDEGAPDGIALDQLQRYASPLLVAQITWNHIPEMQKKMNAMGLERPTFNDQDITHISAYLREFSRGTLMDTQYLSPGNPNKGSVLFITKQCSYCHATKKNQPSVGNRLNEMDLHQSVTAIAGTMWNHGDTMWETIQSEELEWPMFEGSEMADLIAYLYFFDYQGSPGNSEIGKEVFEEKSCHRCHATGDALALSRLKDLTSPTALVKTMWNHVPYMRELTVSKNISWPNLSADDLRHLYAYLTNKSKERK